MVETVELNEGADEATLEVCTVSDGEVFMVTSEQVVSSGVRTTRTTETMTLEGNTWRLAEREVISVEDGSACEQAS